MSTEIQFDKAQFSGGDHCAGCQNRLEGSYFRLNAEVVCSSCAEKSHLDHQYNQNQGAGLGRAVLFGLGAAAAGAAIYGAVAVLTGYEFALIAIFIGWLVGKAMMRGSRGISGKRFQVAAVLITYLSITAGYVPGIIKEVMNMEPPKEESASVSVGVEPKAAPSSALDPVSPAASDAADETAAPADASDAPLTAGGFFLALRFLFSVAAMAPFLNLTSGISGLLGVVIIGAGLMQAWKETREQPFAMSGPFPFEPRQPEKTAEPA